jgi:predicted RNase H-like HicB family nuclease
MDAMPNKEPFTMFSDYIQVALRHARYEILPDDGTYYGEIPEFNGVNANSDTLETCRKQLVEILEEWILFRVYKNLPLSKIAGVKFFAVAAVE